MTDTTAGSAEGAASPDEQGRICEVRWHGRGGHGAISSAQILAHAAFLGGFRGVTSAPTFGAERRGAPVSASTRLSPEPIRVLSQIEHPDVVLVLDDSLLEAARATEGIKQGGWLIVNSAKSPRALRSLQLEEGFSIATVNATRIAESVGLVVGGAPMVNSAMLGAFARVTEMVSLANIQDAIAHRFRAPEAAQNFEAAQKTFYETNLVEQGDEHGHAGMRTPLRDGVAGGR
jgi:pyruvate ferredoxin oxidoreductase gamma subunit